jgi:CRISPR/Cas system CMR-associated protein Cmr5 small subunit
VNFEFSAPYKPEQNGKIERKYATLYGKARTMLNWGKFPQHLRNGLWAQCANTVSKLENILTTHVNNPSASEKIYGNNPRWISNLRIFGEIGIVHDSATSKMRGKLADRGHVCIFIGYHEHHASNVYQFLKLSTKSIILSRNVIWLHKSYVEYHNISDINIVRTPDNNENDKNEIEDNAELEIQETEEESEILDNPGNQGDDTHDVTESEFTEDSENQLMELNSNSYNSHIWCSLSDSKFNHLL